MSSISIDVIRADSSAVDAQLLLGLKGDKGDQGDTGASAGFGTVTASVDANVGTPSVTVTASGTDTAKNFDFAFHNLKGADGVCDVNDVKVLNKLYGTDTESYTSQLSSGDAFLSNADFGTLGYVEATSSGSGAFTVSDTTSLRLSDGGIILVKFGADSSNGSTLNIHSADVAYTGNIPIYVNGSAVSAGDIKANDVVALSYDSGNNRWHVIGRAYPQFTSSRDGLVPAAGNVSETGEWKLLSNTGWLTVGAIADYDSPQIPWARKYSAELSGVPTAPTASASTDNTQIATTAFVHDVVDSMTSGVSDVTVDGTSIVSDGVADIPYANEDGYGVVKIEEDSGLAVTWTDADSNELTYHLPYLDQNFKISSLDLPIATSSTFGAVKFNDGNASTTNGYVSITGSGGTARCVPLLNGEYVMNPSNLPLATTSASGAMSASDKSKLDGIEVPTKVSDLENDVPFVDINQLYSILPTDTASGSIASFLDGADDVPMLSVVADIEPIQDLHGYDKPWSGGAGKNKCSVADNTFVQFDEKEVEPIPSGTYVFSAVVTSTDTDETDCAVIFLDADKNTLMAKPISRSVGGARVSTSSFTISAPIKYIRFYASNGFPSGAGDTATFADIMIESGSSATAYSPYSNICPIYGHTKEVVEQRGINVWDEEWEVGLISASNGQNTPSDQYCRTKNYISVIPSTDYYLKNVPHPLYLRRYGQNKEYLGYGQAQGNGVWAFPSDTYFVRFCWDGTTYNNDISINYPSTDHDYHAYQGETTTTQFGQTVYGGSVDLVSGVLTVDRASKLMSGASSEGWNLWDGKFVASISGIKRSSAASHSNNIIIADRFEAGGVDYRSGCEEGEIIKVILDNNYIACYSSNYADINEFKASLAESPMQVVYELATPTTIQLTPQEIDSFKGANNLWASTGEIEVEYRADIGLYIEKKLS